MERGESVNAVEMEDDPSLFGDNQEDGVPEGIPAPPVSGDQGPCLYFGPAGQRCNRRAVEGSFCARHQPGAVQVLSLPQISRRGVAVIGLLAVLWPVLADLIREVLRLLR
jgi:hypothetical protein